MTWLPFAPASDKLSEAKEDFTQNIVAEITPPWYYYQCPAAFLIR